MRKVNDEVTPTGSGITETSPTPLAARPAAFIVGGTGPGQPSAPTIAVKATTQGGISEYAPRPSRLPEQISARQITNDDSNPDGCAEGGWWRR
jgi:hypothetical protein